jgi:hypothetical protein
MNANTSRTIEEIDMNIDDYKKIDVNKTKIKKRRSVAIANEFDYNNNNNNNPSEDSHLYSNSQNYTLMNKLLKEQNIQSDPKDYYVSSCYYY